jgi:hypothetical protein
MRGKHREKENRSIFEVKKIHKMRTSLKYHWTPFTKIQLVLAESRAKSTSSASWTSKGYSRSARRTTLLSQFTLTVANSAPLSTGKKVANHIPWTPWDKQTSSKAIWSGDFQCSPIDSNTCNRGHFSALYLRFVLLPDSYGILLYKLKLKLKLKLK